MTGSRMMFRVVCVRFFSADRAAVRQLVLLCLRHELRSYRGVTSNPNAQLGVSLKNAREHICRACRSGDIATPRYGSRYFIRRSADWIFSSCVKL